MRRKLAQCHRGQHCASPGAKILGGELVARNLAQIVVDISRPNRLLLAARIDILKQLVARQVAAALDDSRQPPVVQRDRVVLATFTAKLKREAGVVDDHMLIAHSRESIRLVRARVLAVADTNQRRFQ